MKKEKSRAPGSFSRNSYGVKAGELINRAEKKSGEKNGMQELLHELQVYQVELEMQNDELRVSQEALEKERIRFSNLFNLAPVSYFILNKVLLINECNDAGLDLMECDRTYAVKKRFLHFVTADNYDTFYSFVSRLVYSKKRSSCEIMFRTQKGKRFHGLLEGSVIYNHVGNEPLYYFAIIDVTEKKMAELHQREIKDRLEMALKASSTGTLNITTKNLKVKLDSFALKIFGLSGESWNGSFGSFIRLFYIKNRRSVEEVFRAAIEKEEDLHMESQVVINGEIRQAEVKGHVIGDGIHNYFAGIIIDVTERNQLEEEARMLKEMHHKQVVNAVIEAQENERVRISSALHDSVGQLLYATSLSLDKSGLEDKAIEHATNLLNEAIRETRNISFELAPSILSDYGLEVALKEMIKRYSVSTLRIQLKITGLTERLQPGCELFMFRMIQELMNNVVKHSGASEAQVELVKKESTVNIKVKDNGTGINPSPSGIMGTGLSSIRNRVELYNGRFEILSENGKGTEVRISVPKI